jgi:hypothetical protein
MMTLTKRLMFFGGVLSGSAPSASRLLGSTQPIATARELVKYLAKIGRTDFYATGASPDGNSYTFAPDQCKSTLEAIDAFGELQGWHLLSMNQYSDDKGMKSEDEFARICNMDTNETLLLSQVGNKSDLRLGTFNRDFNRTHYPFPNLEGLGWGSGESTLLITDFNGDIARRVIAGMEEGHYTLCVRPFADGEGTMIAVFPDAGSTQYAMPGGPEPENCFWPSPEDHSARDDLITGLVLGLMGGFGCCAVFGAIAWAQRRPIRGEGQGAGGGEDDGGAVPLGAVGNNNVQPDDGVPPEQVEGGPPDGEPSVSRSLSSLYELEAPEDHDDGSPGEEPGGQEVRAEGEPPLPEPGEVMIELVSPNDRKSVA